MEELKITLQKHPMLDVLSEILQSTLPDWPVVMSSIMRETTLIPRRGVSIDALRGMLLEQHISLQLFELIKNEVGISEVAPSSGVHRLDTHTLEHVVYREDGTLETEYDALVNVKTASGTLVAVIEATTSDSGIGLTKKAKTLSGYNVQRHLHPIELSYPSTNIGYLFCTLKTDLNIEKVYIPNFRRRNGYVVQIPASRIQLDCAADELLSLL